MQTTIQPSDKQYVPSVPCADCGTIPVIEPGFCGSGYATLRESGKQICYACADKRQRADLLDRSKPFGAYLNQDKITTWTGGELMRVSARWEVPHNWARKMTCVRATDCHGNPWHGRGLGDGMCITLHPSKIKSDYCAKRSAIQQTP